MRLIVSLSMVAIASVVWLSAGRRLTSLLDRLVTLRVASLPVSPVSYDGGGFVIGQLQLTFGSTDNQRADLVLHTDTLNQVVMSAGGRSFILGPRTNPVDPSGRPEIDFAPTAGDELSLTARRSVVGWPTPFEFNLLVRHSPWWKRYVYYRLVWHKRDGAKLEMLWRYEQHYYATDGWTKPEMLWNWHTGVIRVAIRPPASQMPARLGR
jgi:hypothetical protein